MLSHVHRVGGWRSLPNLLTGIRFGFVPLLAIAIIAGGGASVWAVIVFIVAIGTDAVDGWIARRYGSATDLGALLDPIADKALIAVALILLAVYHRASWWVVGVIILREAAVTALRAYLVRQERGVMPAAAGGKLKTLLQAGAISVLLFPWTPELDAAYVGGVILLVLSAAVAVVSGGQYAYRAWKMLRST